MKALVVDDDRNTVEVILKSVHWETLGIQETFYAYEIAGARKILGEEEVDIVICDIEMPMGTGIDLIIWARENEIRSEFLFLTCHESFEFASYAIQYQAAAYLIKPFVPEKMEQELHKLVCRIEREQNLVESLKYRNLWMDSREYLELGFWEDLLAGNIPASRDFIEKEIEKRNLSFSVGEPWTLFVVSAPKYGSAWEEWEEETLEYALMKLGCEVLEGEEEKLNILHESDENSFSMMEVLSGERAKDVLGKGEELIRLCDLWLGCEVTCYLSHPCRMEELAEVKNRILQRDADNMICRGKVLQEDEWDVTRQEEKPMLDYKKIEEQLALGDQIGVLNDLKRVLETLTARRTLNAATLQTIQVNLTQIVYVYLYKNGIWADELFSDKAAMKLRNRAANSAVDMMKWQNHLIRKTVDSIREVKESDSIIRKIQNYVGEHYREDIGRNEVAAVVYLTPEYMAKLFKRDTGLSLKEYIHQVRIQEAKVLLAGGTRVSEVAQEVGFDNFSYFSTVFKRVTGLSPNEYKRAGEGMTE